MNESETNEIWQTKWYLSYEILYFEHEDISLQEEYLVWENLILIRADSPEQAYLKAIEHGKLSEEKITINDKPGNCIFKGIKKLMPIYEDIEDGCEIEWREYELNKEKLDELIPPKESLPAFLPLTNIG